MPACWCAKKLTAAAVAALHLVGDEQHVVRAAQQRQPLQEVIGRHDDAAHALNRLDNHGADVAAAQDFGHRLQVVIDEANGVAGVEGSHDFGVVGGRHRARGTAVKRAFKCHHAGFAGVEGGQLQRILVGLGPRVAQKQRVIVVARHLAQLVRQLRLNRNLHRVGVEADVLQLLGEALHVVRVAVADGNNGVAAVEIQVFLALVVPQLRAERPHGRDVDEGVNVEKLHGFSLGFVQVAFNYFAIF